MKPSEILRTIKAGNYNSDYGICFNYQKSELNYKEEFLAHSMLLAKISYKDWEHYSNDHSYPVPFSNPTKKVYVGYYDSHNYAYENFNKWSKRSNYGKLRWELLDWLIEQFENKGL